MYWYSLAISVRNPRDVPDLNPAQKRLCPRTSKRFKIRRAIRPHSRKRVLRTRPWLAYTWRKCNVTCVDKRTRCNVNASVWPINLRRLEQYAWRLDSVERIRTREKVVRTLYVFKYGWYFSIPSRPTRCRWYYYGVDRVHWWYLYGAPTSTRDDLENTVHDNVLYNNKLCTDARILRIRTRARNQPRTDEKYLKNATAARIAPSMFTPLSLACRRHRLRRGPRALWQRYIRCIHTNSSRRAVQHNSNNDDAAAEIIIQMIMRAPVRSRCTMYTYIYIYICTLTRRDYKCVYIYLL